MYAFKGMLKYGLRMAQIEMISYSIELICLPKILKENPLGAII